MSTSTPILSRNAVVQVAGTAIGYLTDFTMDSKAELIKEYTCAYGTLATGTAVLTSEVVTSITVGNGGTGYMGPPSVTISGGGGSGATAVAVINSSGVVTSFTVLTGGSGYTSVPTVTLSAPPGPMPSFMDTGNQSITFKASALYVPSLYATLLNDVLNGTVVTVIWGPQGTSSGSGTPKITLSNVVLTAYSVKNGQKGTIANDISGEAQSMAISTF